MTHQLVVEFHTFQMNVEIVRYKQPNIYFKLVVYTYEIILKIALGNDKLHNSIYLINFLSN